MVIDQKAVRKQLMIEGFGLMSPPKGAAMYVRGDEHRNADGIVCDAPKVEGPSTAEIVGAKVADHINAMPLPDQMRLLMGDAINHDTMKEVMGDASAGDVLKSYDDKAIAAYLKSQDVEVKNGAKTPALLQLVEALHA